MIDESKNIIYSDELGEIEPSEEDSKIFKETTLPSNPIELLQLDDTFNISGDLFGKRFYV